MTDIKREYQIFHKYSRKYLSEITGYSRAYISRIASGNKPLGSGFIARCCHTLNETEQYLFQVVTVVSLAPAPPSERGFQYLLETIDGLVSRLTNAEEKLDKIQKYLGEY